MSLSKPPYGRIGEDTASRRAETGAGASLTQAQLREVSGDLEAAVLRADVLLQSRHHADDAFLRSLRDEIEGARAGAASRYPDRARLVGVLSDVSNEWFGLNAHAGEMPFAERRQRSLIFASIVRARDALVSHAQESDDVAAEERMPAGRRADDGRRSAPSSV